MVTRVIEETHNGHDMVTGVIEGTHNGNDMVTGGTEEIRNGHDMVTGGTEEIRNGHVMVTGGTEEIRNGHDMVTGVRTEIRYCPHMVTAVQEEIPYCSPGISSGKQKKARSTSQPQFCGENTPATIEAEQILLPLQQLATINNDNNRISKMPKSLTPTMPTFDGNSEKFELFEDLFQTSLKFYNQLTQEDKINYFYSLMRSDALQMFKNISSPSRENLADILTVFRRKYVKSQSTATA